MAAYRIAVRFDPRRWYDCPRAGFIDALAERLFSSTGSIMGRPLLVRGRGSMSFEVRYSDEAFEQLRGIRARDRAAIVDQIEQVLMVNPTLESKARVKLLRQPAPTQYRLRVGAFRVFYDVAPDAVLIIQILSKEASIAYLGEQS